MEKNKYILLFLCLCPILIFAKAYTEKYIVYFKDKPTNVNVEHLFSAKALEKRKQKQIVFDERDYPINQNYLEQIKCKSVTVLNQSNWLNAVLVSATEKSISKLRSFAFISSVTKVEKSKENNISNVQGINECMESNEVSGFEDNYGSSYAQFHLLNGEYLHEQGYNGENMTIAICDNGFYNANNNPVFSDVFSENRMLGTYDYVDSDSLVYNDNVGKHGAFCFSFIAGIKSNQYIGTATKANFYLFHTEDNGSERLQEEFNLATALERCDQLGVDVVSISLGYMYFDVASENHDTTNIKSGNTPASLAANIAVSKGIIVCSAAGNNDGNGRYIVAPACADSVIAVSSVDVNGVFANTSQGIPGDTRIKPNVAAAGKSVNYLNDAGNIAVGSGTSFATPSLAGMATCLWQAFPAKTNWEIKTAIEQSASQYLTPDKKIGYGIPDFRKAYDILRLASFTFDNKLEKEFTVFPNPFQYQINISNNGNSVIEKIELSNSLGQVVFNQNDLTENLISLNNLPKGLYVLQISTNKGLIVKKLLKE